MMNNESILQEAERIVNGDRNADYGSAIDSFTRISMIASIASNRVVTPLECCLVLKAVKLARQSFKDKRDNLVDECGYTDLQSKLIEWEKNEPEIYTSFINSIKDIIL